MAESIFVRKAQGRRRVVVTGLGVITPVGLNCNTTWENLVNGKSGIAKITQFESEGFDAQIAGEVTDFDPSRVIEKKEQKKMDRFIHFALDAAEQAITDSGLTFKDNEVLAGRSGAILGVGIGGLPLIEKQKEVVLNRGPSRITPFFIPAVITNMSSGHISINHGLKGPNFTLTSACASGSHALAMAAQYIQNGTCDVMITGGCESTVTPLGVGGFAAMKALSTRNEQPELASRPFDRDRDGFVLAEGAGIMVLEDYEHAQRRGAKIYCEVTGCGSSSDAFHMTAGDSNGQAMAMKLALQDAQLNPEDVAYINAHGTSTPVGDVTETKSLKIVFGDHAKKLWVSSTKSMTGHTLGAAGAIESVFTILTLHKQTAPPTINLENPSDDCDLDYVPLTARDGHFTNVLNNSFGFGGTNCSVIFSKI